MPVGVPSYLKNLCRLLRSAFRRQVSSFQLRRDKRTSRRETSHIADDGARGRLVSVAVHWRWDGWDEIWCFVCHWADYSGGDTQGGKWASE